MPLYGQTFHPYCRFIGNINPLYWRQSTGLNHVCYRHNERRKKDIGVKRSAWIGQIFYRNCDIKSDIQIL